MYVNVEHDVIKQVDESLPSADVGWIATVSSKSFLVAETVQKVESVEHEMLVVHRPHTAHLDSDSKPLHGLVASLTNNMNTHDLLLRSSDNKLVHRGFLMLLSYLREVKRLERGPIYYGHFVRSPLGAGAEALTDLNIISVLFASLGFRKTNRTNRGMPASVRVN